jgi:hypothetical protein
MLRILIVYIITTDHACNIHKALSLYIYRHTHMMHIGSGYASLKHRKLNKGKERKKRRVILIHQKRQKGHALLLHDVSKTREHQTIKVTPRDQDTYTKRVRTRQSPAGALSIDMIISLSSSRISDPKAELRQLASVTTLAVIVNV